MDSSSKRKRRVTRTVPPINCSAEQLARQIRSYRPITEEPDQYKSVLCEGKKERFLQLLTSSGKLDYKRYLASPLCNAGGKSLAVGYVVNLLPEGVKKIMSPFFGGRFGGDRLSQRTRH